MCRLKTCTHVRRTGCLARRGTSGVHKCHRLLRVPPIPLLPLTINSARGCPYPPFMVELSEGLPVPREPAYVDKRSHDGEAQATSE